MSNHIILTFVTSNWSVLSTDFRYIAYNVTYGSHLYGMVAPWPG